MTGSVYFDTVNGSQNLAVRQTYGHTRPGLNFLIMNRFNRNIFYCQNAEAAFQLLIGWYNANPISHEPKLELARLHQEFAQIAMIQGRTEVANQSRSSAEQLLQQVLTMEPTHHRALRASGFLKEQSGDISGAVFDYKRSLQANSQQKDLEDRIALLVRQ